MSQSDIVSDFSPSPVMTLPKSTELPFHPENTVDDKPDRGVTK